ncbi:hypothetical protein [Sphingomonas sp. TDK1]|uniref:hypothetical protein n=1 Tax=Sphingomonas sp. TDK1 TaxID=453247 RepID=UPI0007D94F0C|nr:hypothetical protein [Sphingomonas sp. TDK1]OAN65651.1 hypothetical protein A7X12_15110 [Sphingomonas sp. TDK1]
MRYVIQMALGTAALLVSTQAFAQESPCPSGELTRVRLSKLKPGASMADFRAAVAAHVDWYKTHGFKIDQRVAPVLVAGPDGKPTESREEVMTFATGDYVPRDKQDAGWAAYVAKYRAISDMVVEKGVCMPTK